MRQEFQAYLEQQTRRNPRLHLTPAMKRVLLEKCLEKKLLLAEADRLGLAQKPELMRDLQEMREQILMRYLVAYKEEELASQIKIAEDEILNYYQDMRQVRQFHYILSGRSPAGQGYFGELD